MNKIEFLEKLAARLGVSYKQAEAFLHAFESIIIETIKSGGEVTITGFGTFSARRREARIGVNPQNPTEKIHIPAVTVPKFKAGKTLKDALKAETAPHLPDDSSPSPNA